MPHFFNREKNYYVSTSHKVMSSHLGALPFLDKVHWSKMWWRGFTKRLYKRAVPNYLLVRSPYNRLASFYRGKTKIDPQRKQGGNWQKCQIIMLKQLDKHKAPFIEQKDALLSLDFNSFIEMLPIIYKKDGHLTPQSSKIYIKNMYKNILNIERLEDANFIENHLDIPMANKTGSTKKFQISLEWTPETRAIIKSLYAKDFATFRFSTSNH